MTLLVTVLVVLTVISSTEAQSLLGEPCGAELSCSEPNTNCSEISTCICDRLYINNTNRCYYDCGPLENPAGGSVEITGNIELNTLEATFVCDGGFELNGTGTLRCELELQKWSAPPPTCESPPTPPPTTQGTTEAQTTNLPDCSLSCRNGGTCTGTGDLSSCQCPEGFTGTICEIEQYCTTQPCPTGVECISTLNHSDPNIKRFCVCPEGTRGNNCSLTDEPVTCRDVKRLIYVNNPSESESREVCLEGPIPSEANICYNKDGPITFTVETNQNLVEVNNTGQFCIKLLVTDPAKQEECIDVVAYQEDDLGYRPWINATSTVCFVYNRPPTFIAPNPPAVTSFNLASMANIETISIATSDPDPQQTKTVAITGVVPSSFTSAFILEGGTTLTVSRPQADLLAQLPVNVNLVLTVQDDGVPVLSESINMTVQFVNETLSCTTLKDTYYLHSNPLPSEVTQLGQINCVGQPLELLTFKLLDLDVPIIISDVGLVRFDPSLTVNDGTFNGTFSVTVNVTTSLPADVTQLVTFTLVAADLSPVCSVQNSQVAFDETVTVGTCSDVIYTCTSVDPSSRMQCLQPPQTSELFEIRCDNTPLSIAVCAQATLRQNVGEFAVSSNVTNNYGFNMIEASVKVNNINDRPVFMVNATALTTLEVSSTAAVSSSIVSVMVSDPDISIVPPNDTLTVELIDTSTNAVSSVFGATLNDDQNQVNIVLQQSLSGSPDRIYNLRLTVTDSGGLTDAVPMTIAIKASNDFSPECLKAPYEVTLSVRTQVGSGILLVTCTDQDTSAPYNVVTYSIQTSSMSDYFLINADTGMISIGTSLSNLTEMTSLALTIIAADGGGRQTTASVVIYLNSSFPPQCNQSKLTMSLSENTDATICSSLDHYCVEDDPLSFNIIDGNGTSLFSLNTSKNPDLVSLCTTSSLKGHIGIWQLRVNVSSTYGATTIVISVAINDINDPPAFTPSSYDATVPENVSVGATVMAVSAVDQDVGVLGDVNYYSQGIDDSAYFALSRESGLVTVKSPLDAETSNSFVYTLLAIDGAPSPYTATATLSITVSDVNDNPPQCSPSTVTQTVSIMEPVGTVVTQIVCTDADRSPDYSEQTYTISDSSVFDVNATGHVYLVSQLDAAIKSYTLTVNVLDTDTQSLSTTVLLQINIFTNIPPECSILNITNTISETKPVGACLDRAVICTDPVKQGVTLTDSVTGSGSTLMEIRSSQLNDGDLSLNACVKKELKKQFGTYELSAIVTNGLQMLTITWTFTVEDLNEQPIIANLPNNITVLENIATGIIFQVNITDPDIGNPNPDYGSLTVTADLTNNEDFKNQLNDSIFFVDNLAFSFYATGRMNATIRDKYIYRITATDGGGLYAGGDLVINVGDVNESPFCVPSELSATVDILHPVGDTVLQLQCSDGDKTYDNTFLDYSIVSGDPDNYFNVSSGGTILVKRKLPRTNFYDTGRTTLALTVKDRGSSPLQTSVSATVVVNNKIPPTCSPVVTPPDVWVIDACATITMDCSDPTTNSSDYISYQDPTGNFTQGFRLSADNNTPKGIFRLCYFLKESGQYEIIVRVDNGLSIYEFRRMIVVGYAQATPVFTQTKYETSVSENLGQNSSVLKVSAKSQNLIGDLVYHVIESESTSGWSDYFTLHEATGSIDTTESLKPIADEIIVLRVRAEDTGSKLRSSAQVEITVLDMNEPPVCSSLPETKSVLVDLPVRSVIASVSCSDPDRKLEYKMLSYELSAVTGTFKMNSSEGQYTIMTQVPLDVNTEQYGLVVTVSDNAATPLQLRQTMVIQVNLLPPAVTMVTRALSYDVIQVSWMYERADFYSVTNSFVVVVTTAGAAEITSPVLGADVKSWNATGLVETTRYEVKVRADTDYGQRLSPVQIVNTPEIPQIKRFTAITRLPNIVFTSLLRDTQSKIYFDTSQNVLTNFGVVLKGTPGYAGLTLLGFRPANSIYVDLQVAVNQSGTVDNTINVLNETVATGWINSLSVDSGYFVATSGGFIEVTSISTSPAVIFNGTSVTITCDVVTVGFVGEPKFIGHWTFNGNLIQPSTSSRYSISFSNSPDIPEVKYTMLTTDPVLARHAGTYGCHVSTVDGTVVSTSKTTTVDVVSQPVVNVSPKSKTVQLRDPVNITCGLSPASFTPFDGFNWYIDGVRFQQQIDTDIQIESSVAMETLIVTRMSKTTVFGCEGHNEAGIGKRVFSHIGVRNPAKPECPAGTDSQGTSWTLAVAGTSTVLDCATGYSGQITRYCADDGKWESPVYDCVTDTLVGINDELDQIEDGASTTNTTAILDQLVTATNNVDLKDGDIESALNSLETLSEIANFTTGESTADAVKDTDNFLQVASNLIDERNRPRWVSRLEREKGGAMNVPGSVEDYIQRRINAQSGAASSRTFNVKNIYAEVGTGETNKPYQFPDRSQSNAPTWITDTKTRIDVPADAFKDLQSVRYGASFYRNITSILELNLLEEGSVKDVSSRYDINSDIVSLKVQGLVGNIDPPVIITFQHFDSNYSKPVCCYWDFQENTFKTDGCSLQSTSDEYTECSCNHLTNFAILMSPGRTPEADIMALSIISAVGCAISIVCLLVTIILHIIVWRYVKSERAVLLLNLCLALIISYCVFLGGVGQADSKDVCTAMSLLLHYFYLTVFFLMLAYGIEILVAVKYVFVTRSRIRWLLPLAWLLPLVIVAISAGITQLEGYGNESFCWLDIDSGLLYAFVGPAGLCILVNFIIVIIVFRTMFKSSAMLTKSDKEKAKVSARSICVLLPILGLTWVFGIFSVNEDLVAFQYIFAILNSLQGLFIFIFHGLMNNQIKDALKQRRVRKKSLATFESDFKNQRTTSQARSESTDLSEQRKNNEPLAKGSNPFLEVDRQVQAMVLASKKKGTNLYDNADGGKNIDKPGGVDLDDVKISNILRESEVMSGTAGISSILDSQPAQGFGASSKRYDYFDPTAADRNVGQTGPSKPAGYEKLLLSATKPHQYSNINKGGNSDTDRSKERDRERAREKERQRQREQEQRERERAYQPAQVRLGYDTKDGSTGSKTYNKSSRSSKSDEDREGRHREKQKKRVRVYMPYADPQHGSKTSVQNITSIDTAIPMKYDQFQGKQQKKPEPKKKKPSVKDRDRSRDRSRDYEYSFETTYMGGGGQSRHASLENVNMQNYVYGPYNQANMVPYQRQGRPVQHVPHHQQWDPYSGRHYQDPYDPYRGDYW